MIASDECDVDGDDSEHDDDDDEELGTAGGIFGTHYGLPLTGTYLVVTKSHKEATPHWW